MQVFISLNYKLSSTNIITKDECKCVHLNIVGDVDLNLQQT